MNPYYQIPEEPERKRGGMLVTVAVLVVLALALAAVVLWGLSADGTPTPGERVSEEVYRPVTTPVSDGDYELWLKDTEDAPVENIPDTDPVQSVAVSYIDRATVRGWKEPIVKAMETIKGRYEKEGVDILLLGLFDFGLDGAPEILVTTYADSHERYQRYEIMVHDQGGNPLFVMGGGNLTQPVVYAQRGAVYPCMNAYFHNYTASEDGQHFNEEMMIQVVDHEGRLRVLYGVTQVGERYSYMANDVNTSKDGWYGAMDAFEMQYEALGETEMLWYGWPFGMDASEIAEQMVTSEQRFVRPNYYGAKAYAK